MRLSYLQLWFMSGSATLTGLAVVFAAAGQWKGPLLLAGLALVLFIGAVKAWPKPVNRKRREVQK